MTRPSPCRRPADPTSTRRGDARPPDPRHDLVVDGPRGLGPVGRRRPAVGAGPRTAWRRRRSRRLAVGAEVEHDLVHAHPAGHRVHAGRAAGPGPCRWRAAAGRRRNRPAAGPASSRRVSRRCGRRRRPTPPAPCLTRATRASSVIAGREPELGTGDLPRRRREPVDGDPGPDEVEAGPLVEHGGGRVGHVPQRDGQARAFGGGHRRLEGRRAARARSGGPARRRRRSARRRR